MVRSVEIPTRAAGTERPRLERTLARSPFLIGRLTALVAGRPSSSRTRRRILGEAFGRSFAAINRRDYWFVPFVYEPDCEIHAKGEWSTLGLSDYHGYGGWLKLMEDTLETFPDLRWAPKRFLDLGERVLVQGIIAGSGATSGARTDQQIGSVYRMSPRGRIARQDLYWTWDEALAAEGLHAPPT